MRTWFQRIRDKTLRRNTERKMQPEPSTNSRCKRKHTSRPSQPTSFMAESIIRGGNGSLVSLLMHIWQTMVTMSRARASRSSLRSFSPTCTWPLSRIKRQISCAHARKRAGRHARRRRKAQAGAVHSGRTNKDKDIRCTSPQLTFLSSVSKHSSSSVADALSDLLTFLKTLVDCSTLSRFFSLRTGD